MRHMSVDDRLSAVGAWWFAKITGQNRHVAWWGAFVATWATIGELELANAIGGMTVKLS